MGKLKKKSRLKSATDLISQKLANFKQVKFKGKVLNYMKRRSVPENQLLNEEKLDLTNKVQALDKIKQLRSIMSNLEETDKDKHSQVMAEIERMEKRLMQH